MAKSIAHPTPSHRYQPLDLTPQELARLRRLRLYALRHHRPRRRPIWQRLGLSLFEAAVGAAFLTVLVALLFALGPGQ